MKRKSDNNKTNMIRIIIGIMLVGIVFSGCNNVDNECEISLDTNKRTILLESKWNAFLKEEYGFQKWEPSKEELMGVEKILCLAIKNNEFDFLKTPINNSLNGYYYQYIPFINKDGEKEISINAFCELLVIPPFNDLDGWKNEYVSVDDGGACYWQMKVNLDKKSYYDFHVNK